MNIIQNDITSPKPPLLFWQLTGSQHLNGVQGTKAWDG